VKEMRGSIKWQTAQLARAIFEAGISKQERTNSESERYGKISSYKTMETYRDVWNDLGRFAKEKLGVKDFRSSVLTDTSAGSSPQSLDGFSVSVSFLKL